MNRPESIEVREPAETQPGEMPPLRWRTVCAWSALVLALLLQYGLFREYALREVAWAYPPAHDQTQYILDSYDIYEHIVDKGISHGLLYGLSMPTPQGFILHVQASLIYLVLGPGRLSALTLNFLYFALLQGVLAWTLYWLTRRWSMVCIGLGLLLSASGPFFWAGGIMDFRIDFAAMCLFGVVICLTLRSGLFASRAWSVVVGVAASYLIVFRTITVVFLSGIIGLFVGFLVLRLWALRRDDALRRLEWRRLANLALASALVAVLTIPLLYHQRHILKDYYIKGHLPGEESRIRMLISGHSMGYYPIVLAGSHAGPVCARLAALALAAAALLGWTRRRTGSPVGNENGGPHRSFSWSAMAIAAAAVPAFLVVNSAKHDGFKMWCLTGGVILAALAVGALSRLLAARPAGLARLPGGPALVFLTLTLAVPLVILTVDLHRSPVVAGVGLPALLWLILAPIVVFTGITRDDERRPLVEHGLRALAAIAVLSAGWLQLSQYALRGNMTRYRDSMEELLRLHDAIGETSKECAIQRPQVALTTNVDYLPGRITAILNYERLGIFHRVDSILGGYFDVTQEEALRTLQRCNFAIVARPDPIVTPFDHAMMKWMPTLRAYCDRHLVRLGTYRILGDDVVLYARKMWTEGADAGWITSAGLKIKAPGRVVQDGKLVVRGKMIAPWQKEIPVVHAMLSVAGQSPRSLPAKFAPAGSNYELTVDCRDVAIPPEEIAQIHLTFDRYFVPKEMGINDDTRQLVVPTPEEILLVP